MSFTYDPTTARGRVRLLVADTNETEKAKQIFEDREIDAFLALENNEVFPAAARACQAIAASTAKSAIAARVLTELDIDASEVPRYYMDLAKDYQERAISTPAEEIDSFDYVIGPTGEDESEFVGDVIE